MINDPKPEQDSASQPPSDKTSYDRMEAQRIIDFYRREAKIIIECVFGIKDPVSVDIKDNQGEIHQFSLIMMQVSDNEWWQKDNINGVDRCCHYVRDGSGITGSRRRDFPMDGPGDPPKCKGM